MQEVRLFGLLPDEAAERLVANAPACGDYFGFPMRARYATTRAADVVAQYHVEVQRRAWAYGANVPRDMQDRMVCGNCAGGGPGRVRRQRRGSDADVVPVHRGGYVT